jgi:hypothetical protein
MAYNNYYGNPYYPQPNYYGNNGAMPDILNQMKGQYQQPMMQQQMVAPTTPIAPPTPTQNQTNDIIWVQGEAGAKAYLVAPNNTVTLWDSESPTIYLKTADANGVPSMRVLDFTERTANATKTPENHDCKCGDKFIPKSELKAINGKFDGIENKMEELEEKIKALSAKTSTKTTKTTKTEE